MRFMDVVIILIVIISLRQMMLKPSSHRFVICMKANLVQHEVR